MPEPAPGKDRQAVVAAWSARDTAHAVLPADRAIIEASSAVRALLVDLVTTGGPDDELFDACAVLGRLIVQRGGSPTLASATIDNAAASLEASQASWVAPARAALAEGFAGALIEEARRKALETWEFPHCAVPLGEAALAVAAGYPSDDDEVLAGWSARIARAAALRGVRRAVVSGSDLASAALIDALQLVGVEVQRANWPRR